MPVPTRSGPRCWAFLPQPWRGDGRIQYRRLAVKRLPLLMGLLGLARVAHAETIQVPIGGRPVPLGRARVVCGGLPEPWSVEGGGRMVRPPSGEASAGRSVEARVAQDPQR